MCIYPPAIPLLVGSSAIISVIVVTADFAITRHRLSVPRLAREQEAETMECNDSNTPHTMELLEKVQPLTKKMSSSLSPPQSRHDGGSRLRGCAHGVCAGSFFTISIRRKSSLRKFCFGRVCICVAEHAGATTPFFPREAGAKGRCAAFGATWVGRPPVGGLPTPTALSNCNKLY